MGTSVDLPDVRHLGDTAGFINFEAFGRAVSDSFVPLHLTSGQPERFRGSLRSIEVDEVHVSRVCATDHVVERTPDLIARSSKAYYKLSLIVAGTGLVLQDGREAVLKPNDFAIYATDRPFSLVMEEEFDMVVLQFPKNLLEVPAGSVDGLTAVRLSGADGVGAFVAPYLSRLAGAMEQLQSPTAMRLIDSAIDLVTAMLIEELGDERQALDSHGKLLRQIYAFIDEHLHVAELNPDMIARANFISTRYLHALFSSQNVTVSAWIRTRRLERCHRDLSNLALAERSVSAIAAAWGFSSPEHFSRLFKDSYGLSPREARRRA